MTPLENYTEYLLPGLKYGNFIRGILHTPEYSAYDNLRVIQKAVEFKRKIPKFYIENESDYYYVAGYFGINLTKSAVKTLREELINEIIKVIIELDKTDNGKELLPDHYARLFHALAILKVPKDTELLPGTTKNLMYNAMYMIWGLDDGSEEARRLIQTASWYMAEEIKKRTGERSPEEDKNLIVGIRI